MDQSSSHDKSQAHMSFRCNDKCILHQFLIMVFSSAFLSLEWIMFLFLDNGFGAFHFLCGKVASILDRFRRHSLRYFQDIILYFCKDLDEAPDIYCTYSWRMGAG